ncbi:hypothetical protein C5B85_02385 [Pseudoclavibacter sp. AY1F1]|uniref:hypothetical protein n=1 Tax=Pseudoclavibacter sp. AY1F1 TaxID=2080583 RepID=UPI000CE8F8FC|nr:hypothetical protein [Pseudoclavibacter sp. AY1F1]PPF47140.1 hypothetical protein C5B85_02385 [Pseudoclavibacter sp. AY1F1]
MMRLGFLLGATVGFIAGISTSRVHAEEVAKDIGGKSKAFAERMTVSAEDLRRRSDTQLEDMRRRVDEQLDDMRKRVDDGFDDVKRRVEEEVEKSIESQVQTLVRAGQAREDVLETFEDDDADAMVSPGETATPRHAAPTATETKSSEATPEAGEKPAS